MTTPTEQLHDDIKKANIIDQINSNNGTLINANYSQNSINLNCFSSNCNSSDAISIIFDITTFMYLRIYIKNPTSK